MTDKLGYTSKPSYYEKEYRPIIKIDNKIITDLFNSVGSMDINEVKQQMLREQIPYNIVDNNGNTLIHRVLLENDVLKTENQRLQMIKFLYSENANPDAPNNNNLTPLHIACTKQFLNIIKYLLEIGVDINYQDNFGNTPLHRLMTGNIKPEEKTTIGNLIPRPKKTDIIDIYLWKNQRQTIWENIKNSPFIQAINNTLKNSIGSEEEEINVVREFQEQLLQINLDLNKKDDIKLLKDLQAGSIHKFKSIIEKKWSKFSNIPDILLHQAEPDSYPLDDPSKLAVIKKADTKKHITEVLAKSLSDIKRLLESVEEPEEIDFNDINRDLLINYLTNNRDPLTLAQIEDHPNYLNYNLSFAVANANDYADNIMDLNKNTFIGGARVCNIINNIGPNEYFDLFNNDEYVIPKLVYTIFTDFTTSNGFIGNYNLNLFPGDVGKTRFCNLLAELFVNIINNNLISTEIIFDIINTIEGTFTLHRSLIPLLQNYQNSENKISMLYCIINNYLCNERFRNAPIDRAESNLILNINLSVIYLIAGLINNNGGEDNLVLSISQCMRKSLYPSIFNEATDRFGFLNTTDDNIKIGSIISALIYLLFSTNYADLINNISALGIVDLFNYIDGLTIDNPNLNFIMKYAYNVMNNIDVSALVVPDEMNKLLVYSLKENVCNMISYYHNNMEQHPQNQMVADLIDIIRKKHDNDDDVPEYNVINKLRNFIIQPIDNINTLVPANLIDTIEPDIINIIISMRNSKIFKIINNEDQAINSYLVSEFVLPSRVNCFISKFINEIIGTDDDKMYIMKFVESYYLGMNFIGHMPIHNIEPNIDIQQPRGPTINIETRYNLYNFDNFVNPAVPPLPALPDDNIDFPSFQTLGNENYNRPTNIISYAWVFNNFHRRLNRLIRIFTSRLNFMFNNMLQQNSSSTYANVISYTYPLLLVLSNYSKIIKDLTTDIKKTRYRNSFNRIQNINGENIIQVLDSFETSFMFKISNFETNINKINGYMYLLYYLNATTDKMKIPKFIYHALGTNKPFIVFDDNEKIRLSRINSNYENPYVENNYDDRIGKINRDIGLFSNVINNIGYINKETLKDSYIASKSKKLPPSLKEVLYEFYRFNIIEIIKNDTTAIDPSLITAEVNDKVKNIQLIYLRAKITEELIQLYLKNKINEYGKDIYNQLIRNRLPQSADTAKLFDKLDFSLVLNKPPSHNFIDNIDINTQSSLNLYYSFVEPKKIKKQFYIYPDNYFGLNLLKNKYTINLNLDIIKLMLDNNANIFIHNYEKISPLVMMIKNSYYKALNLVSFDLYDKNNIYSPQKYLMEKYKNHLDSYNHLSESQYNEMVTIIQSNESYNNNLLKYMDVSFEVVVYIMEQFLTENMLRLSEHFNSTDLVQLLALCGFNRRDINDIGKTQYNEKLGSTIIIPNVDEGITIINLIDDLEKKIDKLNLLLSKYNKEREELVKLKININNIDMKIADTINNIANYRGQINKLNSILYSTHNFNQGPQNIIETRIIKRYNELVRELGDTYICYMDGWRQLIEDKDNIERIPSICIKYQKEHLLDMNSAIFRPYLDTMYKFYHHNYHIIKTYFENPRYMNESKVLGFVYDLLVHMTKTFICSNIESIIKKILYEYIINTQNNMMIEGVLEQINLMVSEIEFVLYNVIPQKFVRNSVNIYKDIDDESANPIETVSEILNNLIDLLKTSSYIEINDYTINILKNNVVQYFDTITFKLINNWNVVIENILLFHINHYRIIECMNAIV